MSGAGTKTRAVQKLRQSCPAEILLLIAQMPRAGFCYHPKRMENVDKCAVVKKEMTAVYRENRGRHGDRRIAAGLRDRNFPLDHKAVRRLMKKLGLLCGDRGNIVLARKNRAKSRRICRIGASVPEMGHRRDRVQLVWGEALFISRPRSAQQRSGQLYHFGPSRAEYGRLRAG